MISATKWLPLRIPLALVPSRAASIQRKFSRGAPRGSLRERQGPSFRPALLGRIACPTATITAETAGPRLHRELVLRLLREIDFAPGELFWTFSTP